MDRFKNATEQDVLLNPEQYGMPTFEEFARNREKYLGRDDDVMTSVDRGSQDLKKVVQRHIYEIEGYRCDTLEEVEKIARNQGIPLRELGYRAIFQPNTGQKADILVKFMPQKEITERDNKRLSRMRELKEQSLLGR